MRRRGSGVSSVGEIGDASGVWQGSLGCGPATASKTAARSRTLPREEAVGREPGPVLAELGPGRETPARRLETQHAAQRRRYADRSAAIRAVRDRHHARPDRRARSAARAARAVVAMPGIARRTVGERLGRRVRAELGDVRPAEDEAARVDQALRQERGRARDVARRLRRAKPLVPGLAGLRDRRVLQEDRHTGQGAGRLRPRLVERLLEAGMDDGVEQGIEGLDRADRLRDDLDGGTLAAANLAGELVGVDDRADLHRFGNAGRFRAGGFFYLSVVLDSDDDSSWARVPDSS